MDHAGGFVCHIGITSFALAFSFGILAPSWHLVAHARHAEREGGTHASFFLFALSVIGDICWDARFYDAIRLNAG